MNYKYKIVNTFLLFAIAIFTFSCQKQDQKSTATQTPASSPTEAYKMLFAAVKAKDTEKIKGMMSKATLGLAQFNAERQKISLEKSVENGLVAPTMSDALTEIRDERVKGNFANIEVFNQRENRWEDLPFILEDGGWKLAVGDLFQGKFDSPGRSKDAMEREATNTMPLPVNGVTKFPELPKNVNSMTFPSNSKETNVDPKNKSVEVPKEEKPKEEKPNK